MANMNTAGYKQDDAVFSSYIVKTEGAKGFGQVPLYFTQDFGTFKDFQEGAFQETGNWLMALCVGVFGGAAIGFSAYMQGKVAVASCDALAETGKGTANYFIVIGIVETVALFSLVFCMLLLN